MEAFIRGKERKPKPAVSYEATQSEIERLRNQSKIKE
jgi:hypothetical protein